MAEEKTTILFVAGETDSRYGVKSLLSAEGFDVQCRTSQIRAFQFMTVTEIALVIVDLKLVDATAADFCRKCRIHKELKDSLIIAIGEDDEEGSECIAALKSGADDFVQVPFPTGVLLARMQRLIRSRKDDSDDSLITVQMTAAELPGFLQYLETEQKTGILHIHCDDNDVDGAIYLKEGRLVKANAGPCREMEAISEILCWSKLEVTFNESELQPQDIEFEQELTGTIMNCTVDVDEFAEMRGNLPDKNVMFARGENKPPPDLPREKQVILNKALAGFSVDDLLMLDGATLRQSTLWLHQLIEDKLLVATEPPFHHYTYNTHERYRSFQYFEKRLEPVVATLTQVDFPFELPPNLPPAPNDWMTTAPKLVVCGDNIDNTKMFIQSLADIATAVARKKPIVKRGRSKCDVTRLFFDEKKILDVQQLPPNVDDHVIANIGELLSDMFAVIFLVQYHDRESTQDNTRMLRVLRQRFKGVYYFVVPQVLNENQMYEFRINCQKCGYRLAMDIGLAGSTGECPICNAELVIPDALENVSVALELPDDVPAVMIKPDAPKHCRDLLLYLLESVLDSANIPRELDPPPGSEPEVVEEVAAAPPLPEPEMFEEEEGVEYEESVNTYEEVDVVVEYADPPPPVVEEEPASPELHNVDAILNDDDDFDIDDFIRKVKG